MSISRVKQALIFPVFPIRQAAKKTNLLKIGILDLFQMVQNLWTCFQRNNSLWLLCMRNSCELLINWLSCMWVEQVKLVLLWVTYALLIRRFLKLEYVRSVFEINQFCKHIVCWLIIWCALSKQTLFRVRESWFKFKLNHYQEITRATRVWHA